MKCPITAEKYMTAVRLAFGPGRAAEEVCREIIPLVNQAYEDGLKGVGDYPLNLKEARRGLCGSVFYPA